MLGNLFLQELAVNLRAAGHEGCAETGGEGRRRFGDPAFGASRLGGEARQEVIHRLRRAKPRNRRQHPERVAGQHHHMARMAAKPGRRRVRDRLQRIGAAGVLGQAAVGEIKLQRLGVVDHILHHRRKPLRRGMNLRLGLRRQVDGLGITPALEVEDAPVGPAVLVIANQGAVGAGRKRGLAGT